MKTKTIVRLKLLAFVSIFLISGALMAQGDTRTDQHDVSVVIPNVALLDLETAGVKNISADFTHNGEAGAPLLPPAINSSLWLNYSSILTAAVTSRSVTVSISAGSTPGVNVIVAAAAATSDGVGTLGTIGSPVTLTGTTAPLITSIGSAYTLTGTGKGHQLTYSFGTNTTNFASIVSGTATVTVVYTLVDN